MQENKKTQVKDHLNHQNQQNDKNQYNQDKGQVKIQNEIKEVSINDRNEQVGFPFTLQKWTDVNQHNSNPFLQQQIQKSPQNLDKDTVKKQQQQIQKQFSDNEGDQPRKQTCIEKNKEIQKTTKQDENEMEVPQEQNYIFQIISKQFNNKSQKQNQIDLQIKEENQQAPEVQINNAVNNLRQNIEQPPRVCQIADHDQRQIEFVCTYSQCHLSRFVCSKCLRIGNHKHKQQNQGHILDNKELYEMLGEKIQKKNKVKKE